MSRSYLTSNDRKTASILCEAIAHAAGVAECWSGWEFRRTSIAGHGILCDCMDRMLSARGHGITIDMLQSTPRVRVHQDGNDSMGMRIARRIATRLGVAVEIELNACREVHTLSRGGRVLA